MKNNLTSIADYRREAIKAALSILFFLFVYVLLVIVTINITMLFSYGGIMLMFLSFGFITIMLGIGMIGFGFVLLFFLIKFLFASNKVDRSGMFEIKERHQPKLFQFIRTIAQEAQAPFPKRVYVTYDVNASVFYDSSFWSMFFPVKKNLVIGLGLVNSLNTSELKAVLAHEFGHFSQRTMKIGSYVYNVNRVIYNMLYENEGYNTLLEKWGNASGYFVIFAQLAVQVVRGIQWILKKTYNVVNLAYMGLSREMEFHADLVAASVAGSEPLITALHRLDLAGYSYSNLINFYNEKIAENVKTNNIYPQHTVVMHNLAETLGIESVEGLPYVTEQVMNQLNPSKITIKDQWASHPSNADRTARLRALNLPAEIDFTPAWSLFINQEELQKYVSNQLFAAVNYAEDAAHLEVSDFKNIYLQNAEKFAFDKTYNGFYDNRAISLFDIQQAIAAPPLYTFRSLEHIFDKNVNERLYVMNGLKRDIEIVAAIAKGDVTFKTFEYDGIKYEKEDSRVLLKQLEQELEIKIKELTAFESAIFHYFYQIAVSQGKQQELVHKYENLFLLAKETEQDVPLYVEMMNILQFVEETTPYHEIELNLKTVASKEMVLKTRIQQMLTDEKYQLALDAEKKAALEKYISQNWVYFKQPHYDDAALATLFAGMHTFIYTSSEANLALKREVLDFQISMTTAVPTVVKAVL